MNRFVFAAIGSAVVLISSILHAQVPQLINYQGRVAVGTTNFNGSGVFKFALVDAVGTTTYWSNDGTSSGGSQPTAGVTLTVAKGLYSVLLGDTSLTNMTAVPASVFNNADVRLRVWFNDGTNGSQLLTPDQRIAAVGYAVIAGNVPDGAITSAKIANGAVGSAQLAAGAAAANLGSSGQSGVGSGGVIFSATDNNAALIAAGYVMIGTTQTGNNWLTRSHIDAPNARSSATAVWTGTEMIVWGGKGGLALGEEAGTTGGRYNPSTNTWTATSTTNAPAARYGHTAVWTGAEMIVWGGLSEATGQARRSDGGRYNPATNTWLPIAASTLSARNEHTAVWTGSVMIIWGGQDASGFTSNGSRYDPVANSWTNTAAAGIPARSLHSAVWTGSRMLIFGGVTAAGRTRDGSRYNPTNNAWS
ncbi:MAG: Kelch repeat-containing protein, partial [Chthoniobacterales bacterium]